MLLFFMFVCCLLHLQCISE